MFLKGDGCQNSLKILIESFYIYMYTMAIIWILFMFFLLVIAKRDSNIAIKSSFGLRKLSAMPSSEGNSLFDKLRKKKEYGQSKSSAYDKLKRKFSLVKLNKFKSNSNSEEIQEVENFETIQSVHFRDENEGMRSYISSV